MSDSLQPHGLWPTRFLRPWDFPGKNTEWVAISFSRRSLRPRDWIQVSCIVGRSFTIWATRERQKVYIWGLKRVGHDLVTNNYIANCVSWLILLDLQTNGSYKHALGMKFFVCREISVYSESVSCSVVSDFRDLMDCSPPGSSVHEIHQARILGWVAISHSGGSSQPRDQTCLL